VSKKIGEVKSVTGAKWEVWATPAGVSMAGGATIEPDDASALARLLLDAAHESRVMRMRTDAALPPVQPRKHRAPNATERALGEGAHLSNDGRRWDEKRRQWTT